MIRLSVTDLDSYLYWRESEEMTLQQLVDRLRGLEPPNDGMLAGRAFHKLLENVETYVPAGGDLRSITVDGFTFDFALDSEIAIPRIRELKGEVVIATRCGPVTLVGKVDALRATTVTDYKLTERFDAERYADSYQWRAYLAMFGARVFEYEAFQFRWDTRSLEPRLIVYEHHPLRFYAYEGMQADLERQVEGLAEIVALHVPEKIQEAA